MVDTTPTTVPTAVPTAAPTGGDDPFPSYGDWLTSHDSDILVDLLWRLRTFRGHRHSSTDSAAIADSIHSVADIAALRQLDATSLAVLHGLVRAGATNHPVTMVQFTEAFTTLCDSADTPNDRRPAPEALPAVLATLAASGLVYGPALRINGSRGHLTDLKDIFPLAVPAHLNSLFAGTTDLPWVLIDGYRCPIPTAEIPSTLAALPDRQRALLDTLANAGGIGHSATLDDIDRPLARMISVGLLDRIDTDTARLSPRVAATIAGRVTPDPGGNFAVLSLPPTIHSTDSTASTDSTSSADSAASANERTTGLGIARAVETLQRVADLLTELGTTPLRPLSSGGVGVREITRISRKLDLSAAEATEILLLCRHADFIASDDTIWGVTPRGAEFINGATAQRWALLLSGWADSPHAPWDVERTDARLLQESLDQPRTAALRHATATLLCTLDPDITPGVQLWRLRPALAARTDNAALSTVLQEAEILGLSAGGRPTGAAFALAHFSELDHPVPVSTTEIEPLVTALNKVLPEPVRTLIIQADLTVLAPGLLNTHTETMLRRIATVESTGMASVWRISPESLAHAAAAGETAEGVRNFLNSMAPEIPQGLDYLISDAFRSAGVLTADTAATVLTAPDENTLSTALAALTAEDIRDSGLRRLAPTVAISHNQLSRVVHTLEDAGIQINIEGDSSAASPHGPLLTLVPNPWRPEVTREEVADQLEATVESFRRSRQLADSSQTTGMPSTSTASPSEAVHDINTTTVHDPRAIISALRSAYDQGTHVQISYVNAEGTAIQEWISVVTMSPVSIIGVTDTDGTSLRLQPHRIAWVATPIH